MVDSMGKLRPLPSSFVSQCNVTAKNQPKTFQGACERCHKRKEGCKFERAQNACARCRELGQPCILRLRRRMGRRPVAKELPFGATSILCLTSDHQDQLMHRQIDRMLGTIEGFFEIHRIFMLGPTFASEFQATVRRMFSRSPQVLRLAYSVAMKSLTYRHSASPDVEDNDLMMGTQCLQKLVKQSPSTKHADDAAAIVLIGQALLVQNTLTPSPDTQIITRGTLFAVQDWYPIFNSLPYLDCVTLTPILMDTVDCLIKRELPVIRVSLPDRCIVDRFLGIRSSLLPLLYELCERSYKAKATGVEDICSPHTTKDIYSDVEGKIRDWTPRLPPSFFTTYSTPEVGMMLAQARTYCLGSLLVIHRLRYPLGIEDCVAQKYAKEIIDELSVLKEWPHGAATGLGLDFPLLVATLEMPEPGSHIYEVFESIRFRRQHSAQLLNFVKCVRAARGKGYKGVWFNLVQDQLQGVTLT